MDEILWCYHSNETSSAVISHGTIYLVCSSTFSLLAEVSHDEAKIFASSWETSASREFYLLSLWTKSLSVTIQMKPLWQNFYKELSFYRGSLFRFFLRPVYTVHFTLQWTTLKFWTVWHRYFVISRGSLSPGLLQSTPLPLSEANTTGTRSSSSTPFPGSTGPLYQNEVKCSAFDMKMIFHSHANETHFHKKVCAVGLILKMRVLRTRKWRINQSTTTFRYPRFCLMWTFAFVSVVGLLVWGF